MPRNNVKHGMTDTKVHRAWSEMKRRCLNPNRPEYKYYGGRGISVCESWISSFEEFYKEIGDPPSEKHTLERIDNEKGYAPGNIRWETVERQCNNRRSNVFIEFNGTKMTMADWARRAGISLQLLFLRLKRGWTVERAVTTPARQGNYR